MEKSQKEGYGRRSGYYDTRQERGQRRSVQTSRAYTDDRYAARRTAGNSSYAQGSRYSEQTGNARSGNQYQGRTRNPASGNSYPGQTGKKRRRRKKKHTAFIILILVLVLLFACAAGAWVLYPKEKKSDPLQVEVSIENLDSPYAILIDKETGEVIASKSGDTQIYPASMTKILTVLVAIEQIKKLDSTITMSYDYYDALYAQDASRAGFEPGEETVIRDLLYGAMLPSGAECCMELAIQAAGSEAAMAELMNQKVTELGLTKTHFTNCTGLHSDDQYTTPHEMASILQAALKNKTFREVITTHNYTVKPTNVHAEGFTFWSTMFKNMQAENVIGGEILGGKTGYTGEAGHCLASFAEIDEREYILVTAGWATEPRTEQYHINDAFLGYNALGRALAEAKNE